MTDGRRFKIGGGVQDVFDKVGDGAKAPAREVLTLVLPESIGGARNSGMLVNINTNKVTKAMTTGETSVHKQC